MLVKLRFWFILILTLYWNGVINYDIILHILNLKIPLVSNFTAVLSFPHLVSLLSHFTIKWITQYTVL